MNFACAFSRERDIRYGSPASADSLRNVKALGADWIAIMPFGFQRSEPHVRLGGYETDDSLRGATEQAHALGMHVLLKPHVWIRDERAMERWNDDEWRQWFADYATFITHYATLARDMRADALSIGNELKLATKHEGEWREVIRAVRAIYKGPLTYGANFDEVFDVRFWDVLDWIGVSAYFPLAENASPDRATLVAAWQPVASRLEALSLRFGKSVLFTEIGYRSANGAAWRQWEIPRDAPLNLDAQRVAYEAFFETIWPRPWVAGAYPWKWFSVPNHSGPDDNDYEIENKPAAEVVRRAYSSSQRTSATRSSIRR